MKVGVLEMFEEYKSSIYENKQALTNHWVDYQRTKDYLVSKLDNYKHYIDNFTNIDFNELANLTKTLPENAIKGTSIFENLNLNVLKSTINGIAEVNREINKIKIELEEYNIIVIKKEKIFKEILYKFNCKIGDAMLYQGYIYRPGFGLGKFGVKKIDVSKRKKKQVDWNQSNIKKAELITNGITPYKVLERDEKNNITKDNGGEKWFVYFTKQWDYIWNWGKGVATAMNVPYYKFRPTVYNNLRNDGKLGLVNKLKQLEYTNSPLLANFYE